MRSPLSAGLRSRPRIARPATLLVAAVALVVPLAGAPAVQASKLVYTCGDDLCAVDPDSGASAKITSDGTASAYRYPSITRDGHTVAAARGNDVMVGRYGRNLTDRWAGERDINGVAIAPDGSGVAESHSYVVNRYGCPLTGGCLELVDMSGADYTPRGAEGDFDYPGGGGVGFLGSGTLLSSLYTLRDELHSICAVQTPGVEDATCDRRIASPRTLTGPAGSPDGRLIAAGAAPADGSDRLEVVLFDAVSGATVGRLASDGHSPAFSPDARRVAYAGPGGWIYVVATRGGKAKRLVKGGSPTWGGGAGPGPAVASKALRYRGGRIAVAVGCGVGAACRGTVRIAKGRTTLAKRAYRVKAGGRATVRLAPTAAGRAALARSARQRVAVHVTQGKRAKAVRKLTLRR